MTATPFKGTIAIRYLDGEPDIQPFACTDVANTFVNFTASGLTFYQTRKYGAIADIQLITAGVDTSQIRLYVNNKDTGNTFLDAGVLASVNNRMPLSVPIAAGAQIQLRALA